MRILLVSDIHANLEAFEACLAAVPNYDRLVNLGDIVGYGASPNEVAERSRELSWHCVRGNHDKACVGLMDVESFNPVAALAAYWTRQTLTQENLEWLRALPQGPIVPEELEGVQFVHGSPLDEDDYLITLNDIDSALHAASLPVTFFGHSHIQGGFLLNGAEVRQVRASISAGNREAHQTFRLDRAAHYFINPGSVGQPRDGDWRAGFAVFDSDAHNVTFYRVPYDVKSAQKRILEAGLPERLATRLTQGR